MLENIFIEGYVDTTANPQCTFILTERINLDTEVCGYEVLSTANNTDIEYVIPIGSFPDFTLSAARLNAAFTVNSTTCLIQTISLSKQASGTPSVTGTDWETIITQDPSTFDLSIVHSGIVTNTITHTVYLIAETLGHKTLSKKIIFKFNANEAPTFSPATLDNFVV